MIYILKIFHLFSIILPILDHNFLGLHSKKCSILHSSTWNNLPGLHAIWIAKSQVHPTILMGCWNWLLECNAFTNNEIKMMSLMLQIRVQEFHPMNFFTKTFINFYFLPFKLFLYVFYLFYTRLFITNSKIRDFLL